tara:strand:- start:236 stop:355 length:120 start_codon:yes stop_codon:yes gene_type:complete
MTKSVLFSLLDRASTGAELLEIIDKFSEELVVDNNGGDV